QFSVTGVAGACCSPNGTCTITSPSNCTAPNTYLGDNSLCNNAGFAQSGTANLFEDISADAGATQFTLGDDTLSAIQPIGFTFNYFGTAQTQLYVDSNGWIGFDSTGVTAVNSRGNLLFPNAAVPNNMIAPYWDDLNQVAAPAGTISLEMLGTAPTRRLVVEWKNIVTFGTTNPNTFEVVLFEGSDVIEFRYGAIQPSTTAFNTGLENGAGTLGANVSPGSLGSGGDSANLRFTPQAQCSLGACCLGVGNCTTTNAATCTGSLGGQYQGDGTSCTSNPCTQPGAC